MKTVLITGASRGIGRATAELFAEKGYSVLAHYHKSESCAKDLKKTLNEKGRDCHLFRADVADEKEVAAMMQRAGKFFHRLDVLVVNAGVSFRAQLQDTTEQQWNEMMAVNAKGAFLCAKHALPLLKEGSSVLFVSSVFGLHGASCEAAYSMSKHAVVGLARSLAEELAPCGISVNAFCPPMVETEMTAAFTTEEKTSFNARFGAPRLTAADAARGIFALTTGKTTGETVIYREEWK